jgi:hypothetical protein
MYRQSFSFERNARKRENDNAETPRAERSDWKIEIRQKERWRGLGEAVGAGAEEGEQAALRLPQGKRLPR